MAKEMNLNQKWAFITGASSGIGEATAKVLAKNSINLILLARREEKLQKLKTEILSDNHENKIQVQLILADVRNYQELERVFQANSSVLEKIDILINNAGLARGADSISNAKIGDLQEMVDTNLSGFIYVTKSLLPFLLKNKKAHIVNIGSVAGRWVYPGGAVYCATKAAVASISEGLRMDLMGTGIRVTNIEPGMVETEFSHVRFSGDDEKAKQVYAGMTPLSAQDIAECIWWSLNRPQHVNIQEMVVFPTDQAAIRMVHREACHT